MHLFAKNLQDQLRYWELSHSLNALSVFVNLLCVFLVKDCVLIIASLIMLSVQG